jgi:HSP20 family protein
MPTTLTKPNGTAPAAAETRTPSLIDWFSGWPAVERIFESFPMPTSHQLRVEEELKDNVLTIKCEAPGVDPAKDINVWVENDVLNIEVNRRTSSSESTDGRVRSEFRYGQFRRTLSLPTGVKTDSVNATYRDGILQVTLPMPTPPAPAVAKIPIGT